MPQQQVFRWRDGAGWLILSGGDEPTSAIRASALERMVAFGAVVCVALGRAEDAENTLQDLMDLGAPTGYIVDLATEDDATIEQQITEAGLVVLGDDQTSANILANLKGAPLAGVEAAYGRGAVILAEGRAAAVFGGFLLDGGKPVEALNWLEAGLVIPQLTSVANSPTARQALLDQPTALLVGLGLLGGRRRPDRNAWQTTDYACTRHCLYPSFDIITVIAT